MTFDEAVKVILDHEGGYVFDENDPGGETNFGISRKAYPLVDIKNLTEEKAKFLYRQDYWDFCKCDKLPPPTRLIIFDCAVNQGVIRATTFIQRFLKIQADGIIGPVTLGLINKVDPRAFIAGYAVLRHNAYVSNPNWKYYGAGWSKRLLLVTVRSLLTLTKV
jgi:lysozyme family protein